MTVDDPLNYSFFLSCQSQCFTFYLCLAFSLSLFISLSTSYFRSVFFSLSVGVCFFLSPFLSEYIYLFVSLSIGSFSPCQCPLFYISLFSPYSRSFIFSLLTLYLCPPFSRRFLSLLPISLLGKSLFLGKILLCVDRR